MIFRMVIIDTLFCIISVSALKFLVLCLTETVLSLCKISKSDVNKVGGATRKLCLDCSSLLAEIFFYFLLLKFLIFGFTIFN